MARTGTRQPAAPRGFDGHVRPILYDYSKAAAKFGAKVKAIREATGLGATAMAKRMGMHPHFYKVVEAGRAWPTEEWARRFVRVAFRNEDFRKFKTATLALRKAKGRQIPVVLTNPSIFERARKSARELGVSMSALCAVALESFLDEGRYVTTVSQLVREADRLRLENILQQNPTLITILDGDPMVARYVQKTRPVEVPEPPADVDHKLGDSLVQKVEQSDGLSEDILLPLAERLIQS